MPNDQKPVAKPAPVSKAFDIFRPGKGQPQPTSRPVILSHKALAQDSTLRSESSRTAERHLGHALMNVHKKATVPPPQSDNSTATTAEEHQTIVPALPNATAGEPQPTTPAQTEAIAQPEAPKPAPTEPVETKIAPASSSSTSAETIATDQAFDPASIVVSNHGHGHRWLKPVLIILLSIVVAAAAVDILLDTGTWKPSSNIPHTHFIGN